MARVGVDVDGVMADLALVMDYLCLSYCGQRMPPESCTTWSSYVKVTGTEQRMLELMDLAWECFDIPLEEPGVVEDLQRLKDAGHSVVVVTARTKPSHPHVVAWLARKAVPYDDLVMVTSGMSKLRYPIDYMVDDSPRLVQEATRVTARPHLFLRTQPWNAREKTGQDRIQRVASLNEAVGEVLRLER